MTCGEKSGILYVYKYVFLGVGFLAVHEVHIVKAEKSKVGEYRKIFDGSKLYKHYGENIYDWMDSALSNDEVWIAEDGRGEAVGFMWMQIESVYANMPYLALLGVRTDYRSHGVGQMLIKYFIEAYESKGYDRGFIAVNDFNPLARRLYEDMGFHKFMQMPESLDPTHSLYLLMRKSRKHNSNV